MYLRSCSVESQAGTFKSRCDLFYKEKLWRCAIFVHPHTLWRADWHFWMFLVGWRWRWRALKLHFDLLLNAKRKETLQWISLCRASWRKKGVWLQAAHHFLLFLLAKFWKMPLQCSLSWRETAALFFVCVCVSYVVVDSRKGKRMYDSSQSLTLCLIQLCLFISL